jgi:hypothetical protein
MKRHFALKTMKMPFAGAQKRLYWSANVGLTVVEMELQFFGSWWADAFFVLDETLFLSLKYSNF